MTKRHITYLAWTTTLLASTLSCAAATAAGPMTHTVRPGDSIQKAVDAASAGDTVLLSAGTYRESVRVTKSGLTLRGMGPSTVIAPATSSSNACAKAGSGICVEGKDGHPVEDTTIAALTLSGFAKNGLWSSWTNRLTVQQVTALKNGQWGIAQERSTRGTFLDNTVRDNGNAGLYLANTFTTEAGATDTHGTLIGRNRLQGNRIGVTIKRLRNLAVATNDMTANCAAVFVIGDENVPRAGALTLSDNYIHKNNKLCPKTARVPIVQGAGIVLTGGTENILMTRNTISDNVGTSPFSGGIVLFKSWLGVPNEKNQVSGNILQRNAPADIVKADTGKGNTFQGNSCGTSKPAGLC
ncbi:right-handed parallel beta-helix repeat-containing protein [Streptomyces chiangmaiensis]|uniref:Right-handed parallel beta-helix repeat-containing protein n=1 Tax=Streptomyces chiangmaiensis TaxID=766497 RepID=A0ABU7FGI3_9ACTN|nr:right-handed parallel beta-helix repeat-containing protein [Streptomyces chiangmaiensis]MED7822727.1 right-handed parallel beta-helix repeat-containing protein [Streptomyces chiangmaiensis]